MFKLNVKMEKQHSVIVLEISEYIKLDRYNSAVFCWLQFSSFAILLYLTTAAVQNV